MDFGQVGVVSKEKAIFCVKWRIGNFFSLSDELDSFCVSSHFYFFNMHWFLRMLPNGQSKNRSEGWIGLFLRRSGRGPPIWVRYTFAIRKADGSDEQFFNKERYMRFSTEFSEWGTIKFLRRNKLLTQKSELTPSDALTIVCTMWSDEVPSTDGEIILRKHLQDLLLDGKDHDVTLKVKDQQFRAHKNILRARSPVFAAMFAHNMTENECGDVCIEDCDPSAFGEFLKYVYVGKMENMSPTTATGLYYVADKYDFPDLKKTCVEFLKVSLTTNVISDVINLAVVHGEDELLECALEFFSKHAEETLMTVEWQRFTTSNPILSNEVKIKVMKLPQKH